MKCIFVLLTFLSLNTFAQSEEEKVKQPIIKFFDGMRQSDTNMIKASMAPNAIMQTIYKNKEGVTGVHTDDQQKFISSITKPHNEIYDERITFDVIKIDADLAIAWTPYKFYVGDKFSHCGVNSFQLVKINGQWKIQYVIDTRRKDNCL